MSGRRNKTGGRAGSGFVDTGLEQLLGTLGTALSDIIARLDPDETGELRRDIEVETARGPVHAQAGIRIRMGGAGLAARSAGGGRDPGHPVRPKPAGTSEITARPIVAEVVDDGAVWRLTADLPGVAREDVSIAVEDGTLLLEASGRGRRYRDRIAVPPGTGASDLRVSLQNGILEIEAPSERARGA